CETQVRGELSKKGWKAREVQNMVFQAMSAISGWKAREVQNMVFQAMSAISESMEMNRRET
ncbi:MAG: hypothetical protein F6K19_47590, partial [Cyanothece sp. SIO1E1]|nr:hypothetical protein [Cyanothece sp. SIO1E1]